MAIDPTITFTGAKIVPITPDKPTSPSITNPSKGSIGDFVATLIAAILRIFKK